MSIVVESRVRRDYEGYGALDSQCDSGSRLHRSLETTGQGHCTLTLQIAGGTGRFENAFGTLTLTELNVPVLADALNNPVFL